MMGQRTGLQEQLFYEFRLDDWVPADHLLRKIDAVLDRGSRKTRRWRKPDSNSESRSEKAFHAEPMVCTTLRWRETDSNLRFPAAKETNPLREADTGATKVRLQAVAYLPGTNGSNPSRSSGESGANLSLATIRLPTSRSRGFPRVCWLGRAARSTETRKVQQHRAEEGSVSVGRYSSTAVSPRWLATWGWAARD